MENLGTYGAKVQSWSGANPRDVLNRIIEAMPGASRESVLAALRDAVKEPAAELHLDAIIEYWFANNYRALTEPRRPPAGPSTAMVAEAKATIKQRAERMVLLDMILPNGKALREATGRDCKRAGGWLRAIAQRIKPNERVGDVLTESDVRKLYR